MCYQSPYLTCRPYPRLFSKSKYLGEKMLTTYRPFMMELEKKQQEHMQVKHISSISNRIVALQIALKAFYIKGTIITTLLSFIAIKATYLKTLAAFMSESLTWNTH